MALPLNSVDVLGPPAWFADRFRRIPELHGNVDDGMSSNSNSKLRPRPAPHRLNLKG